MESQQQINLLYFSSDHKIGLSYLLTEQAKYFSPSDKIKLYAVAGEKEQVEGLSKIWIQLPFSLIRIRGLDEHKMFFELIHKIESIINQYKCNIIHVQNNWQLSLIVYIKIVKKKKIKIIYTIHGYRHNFLIKSIVARYLIMIALLFTTDKVLVCSSYVRNKFFLVKHKSTLLFLGLGEEYFSPKYPVPQIGNKIIVFAGQFRKGKNQHVLIKAVARYIQTTKDSDLRLILPGSGPLLDACKQLVKKLNVEGIVTFPGQLTNTEVFNLYQICNMAVVPSNTETFGHCIAEPFALGYCVFTRKTGIAGDIIKDKYSGLFFDSENDLYNLFREYLPYPEKLSFIGKNAFENRDSLRFSKIALHYKSILDGMVVKD